MRLGKGWAFLLFLAMARPSGAQSLLLPTNTPTPPFGWTPTATATRTATATPTGTPTATSTVTWTPTVTSTPTITFTGTQTPSQTPTFTLSPTPTITPTPTMTVTCTPTKTSTPGVFQFSVSPKPDGEGKVRFSWGTTVPADEAFLKIYTYGFRVVREFHFGRDENQEYLSPGLHDFTWDGRDENNRHLPPAVYLCFIDVKVGLKKYESGGKTELP